MLCIYTGRAPTFLHNDNHGCREVVFKWPKDSSAALMLKIVNGIEVTPMDFASVTASDPAPPIMPAVPATSQPNTKATPACK